MNTNAMTLLMGGMEKIKLYTGITLLVLSFVALLAPFALFVLFFILGAGLTMMYYLDKKKALKEENDTKSDEQLELDFNGGKA